MSRLSRIASQGRTGSPPLHPPPGRRPLSFSRRPRLASKKTPVLVLGPHPMMHLCIDKQCNGLGRGDANRALGRAGPQGDRGHSDIPPPHRGSLPSTIFAPLRWPARGGARVPVTWPQRLDRVTPQSACQPREPPPLLSLPHHGEVTCHWAVVGGVEEAKDTADTTDQACKRVSKPQEAKNTAYRTQHVKSAHWCTSTKKAKETANTTH